jgi:hypothetical protein
MRKTIAQVLLIMGLPLGVIFLYALVHEGGHVLFALLFGGRVAEF